MKRANVVLLLAIVGAALMSGCAGTQIAPPTSGQLSDAKRIRQILLDGSPWSVSWWRRDFGRGGVFTQTFAETQDGKVKTTTDEVGPYETEVLFLEEGKAVWTSPHQNVIAVSVDRGKVVGIGRASDLTLEYYSRR